MKKLKLVIFIMLIVQLMSLDVAFAETQESLNHRPKKVLFLCTGNYYRSRFAEAFFNYLSDQKRKTKPVLWRAFSRGLKVKVERKLPVSELITEELNRLKIPLSYVDSRPTQFTESDLEHADYVVALSEREHRPYFQKDFPSVDLKKIKFWDIEDIDKTPADSALRAIQGRVTQLFEELK